MKKILIIEDEPTLQNVLRSELEDAGCTIASALNGDEGIRRAAEFVPDVVLLDVLMPGSDGYAVLDALRRSKTEAGPVIFVLTNLADDANMKRLRSALVGRDNIFIKSNTSVQTIIDAIMAV